MASQQQAGARGLQERLAAATQAIARKHAGGTDAPAGDMPRQPAVAGHVAAPVAPAEAAPQGDPLVEALVHIARHLRHQPAASRIVSGLPLEKGRLALEHLPAAAERAGLAVTPLRRRPSRLAPHHLPALAITAAGDVLAVSAIDRARSVTVRSFGAAQTERVMRPREIDRLAQRVYLLAPRRIEPEPAPGDIVRRTRIAGNGRLYTLAIVATVVVNLIALALPLYTMNVYDRVLPNGTIATLVALSIGAALAGLFDFVLRTLRQVIVDTASRRADMTLALRVFGRVLGARLPARASAVGIQANTLREFETLREFYASMTLTAFGDIPFAILFIAVIAFVGGPLALVPLIAFPLVLLAVLAVQRPLARLNEQAFRDGATKNAVLVETLTGLETIKGLGAESWAASRWERAFAEHLRLSNAMRFYQTLGLNLVAASQTLATIALIVLGVLLVTSGQITAGALMASMMLLSRALAPLSQVAGLASRLHQARAAQTALEQLVAARQERDEAAELIAAPRLAGRIALEQVRFAYERDGTATLDRISLEIAPGERVGIIGGIGSGKSTLLKLIAKLHEPDEGRILIDGVGLSAIDPAWLRSECGYLGQDAVLFQGTIRDNLTMHRPLAGDDAIIRAAESAGALEWISRLSKGLDTRLGERGGGLSGGQRHALALARALLGRPRLLLLDEPTSGMDARTEGRVVERLKRDLTGRTLVVVTHRPAVLELVDRLIVLNNGQVAADGPKAAVLDRLTREAGTVRQRSATSAAPAVAAEGGRS